MSDGDHGTWCSKASTRPRTGRRNMRVQNAR